MIQLVIFDIAGTTVEDPDGVGGCLKAALTAAGVPWEHDAVNAIMGIPKPVAIRMLMEQFAPEMVDDELIQTIFLDFRQKMIQFYLVNPDIKPIDGAVEVFAELRKRGIKVALDTGFDRAVVNALMQRLGWDDSILDFTIASDEVANGRPHPDLVFGAMKLAGVSDVKAVAKVGDTPSDLQEGTTAGCTLVVGVTSGTHTEEQLKGHPHTHLIHSVRDFPALLDGLN